MGSGSLWDDQVVNATDCQDVIFFYLVQRGGFSKNS